MDQKVLDKREISGQDEGVRTLMVCSYLRGHCGYFTKRRSQDHIVESKVRG